VDWTFAPIEASPSASPPEVIEAPPASVERMTEVELTFLGGDPVLGTPEVCLQRREGGWRDVRVAGWIPVCNGRGGELPTFYEGSPTWRERPEVAPREHRWRVDRKSTRLNSSHVKTSYA